jgi:hypothetical protein
MQSLEFRTLLHSARQDRDFFPPSQQKDTLLRGIYGRLRRPPGEGNGDGAGLWRLGKKTGGFNFSVKLGRFFLGFVAIFGILPKGVE